MVVVIQFVTDVAVLADSDEAERIAQGVIEEEIARARAAILARLAAAGVEVTLR